MARVRPPRNKAEAEAVAEAQVAKIVARGYDQLRPLVGEVRAHVLGIDWITGGIDEELGEAVGASGALYHLVTHVHYYSEDAVGIEVSVQEDSEPGGSLDGQWVLSKDGTLVREY